MGIIRTLVPPLLVCILSGCQSLHGPSKVPPQKSLAPIGNKAVQEQAVGVNTTSSIPKYIHTVPYLERPELVEDDVVHTVVVNAVPVKDLLFSIARDSDLVLDISRDIDGSATINAVNQSTRTILDLLAHNSGFTYSLKNGILKVRKDIPTYVTYKVDYINMSRLSESKAAVATQISSTGQGAGEERSGNSNNNSTTDVVNRSDHNFWESIKGNIIAILGGHDLGRTKDELESLIVVNRESGLIGVRATQRQHEEISRFIEEVIKSSEKQVLIEATIAEISLNEDSKSGVDWSYISNAQSDTLVDIISNVADIGLFDRPSTNIILSKTTGDGDTLRATLSALERFGDINIMSRPKVIALNNQTALLKVVDNIVYFTVSVNIEPSDSETGIGLVTYETDVNTVPVGFVMSVTPYINDDEMVTLNMRPTISRVIGQAQDPNPSLAEVGVVSEIPIVQVREVESMLKVQSGQTAVMGGLMQTKEQETSRGVPGLKNVPLLGRLFRYDEKTKDKTELVIFIKPTIVSKNGALHADRAPRILAESTRGQAK